MHYKVSVIVPVYKVREYIEKCAESLMRQTLREIEFIFVDDCTPDDSMDILMGVLERYPERKDDVRIIHHEVNKGLAQSRADGLDLATGDYIIHCDSDDWTDVTMYEKMYSKAVEDDADICISDFYFVKPEGLESAHPKLDCSKPHEKVVYDYIVWLWNTVWNILVSRDVYERSGARPPVGISFTEDFYLSVRLFQYAGKVTAVNEPLYCYNQLNSGSIVHSMSPKVMAHERDCYIRTIEWFKERGVYECYFKPMQWRMLKADCYLVFHNRFKEFRETNKVAPRYIITAPSAYFNFKVKLMLILATLKLDAICLWDNHRHGRYD